VTISRRDLLASLVALPAWRAAAEDWLPLFNGRTLEGWKAGGARKSFRVADGQIAVDGPPSHLFYNGNICNARFRNFELQAEVMTRPGADSGIYFHTHYQADGFPRQGFEVQVDNTYAGEGDTIEHKRTGSLYGVRDIYKQLVNDNEWFRLHMAVRGKHVQIRVNDVLVVDYVEPEPPVRAEGVPEGRVLGRGTFALQCHGPGSKVFFRNLLVRPLPDHLPTPTAERPQVDAIYREILQLHAENFPVVDYHVHLKGGLTLEEALRESRRLGIQYGIAINGGLGFPTTNDAAAEDFLRSMAGQPAFAALQGEGREWVKLFSRQTVAKFDYVFTDAMTFTDDSGKRMRIWMPEEVGEIKNPEQFMEMYVDRILGVLRNEPIDIYANPTFLPKVIAADYDRLWTAARMQRVIGSAKASGVAIEINNSYRVPSPAFIRAAKQAGVKFSFGTNNGDKNLGRMEYCLEMVRECGLTSRDIFFPKPGAR